MYLTAHHVARSPSEQGINVFRHWHGTDFAWPEDVTTLADTNPGEVDRDASRIAIKPGGNRVRAYLDVLSPDNTPSSAIRDALHALVNDLDERRNPTVFVLGSVTIRFGVELGMEEQRRAKLQELLVEVEHVLPNTAHPTT